MFWCLMYNLNMYLYEFVRLLREFIHICTGLYVVVRICVCVGVRKYVCMCVYVCECVYMRV